MRHPVNGSASLIAGWCSTTALFALAVCVVACEPALDFERAASPRGTFGQEVHEILLKDLTRNPDQGRARADALAGLRDDLAWAIDTTVDYQPGAASQVFLDALDQTLIAMMPFYDSGLMPGLLRKLGVLLQEAQADAGLLGALARYDATPSAMADARRERVLAHVLGFPRMLELNQLLADALLAHDGIPEPGMSESDAGVQLQLGISRTLRDVTLDPDPKRFLVRLYETLLREDGAFAAPSQPALWGVEFDHRGMPRVVVTDIGTVPFPFVDLDGDGFADIDAARRFLDLSGEVLDVAPFGPAGEDLGNLERDALGRLVNPTVGGFAFEYVDLNRTALGYLLRDAGGLAEADVPFDLLRAADTALGAALLQSDAHGSYRAYDRQGEVVALLSGLLVAIDTDDVPAVLEGMAILMREHPDVLARVVHAMDVAGDVIDGYDTDVSDDSNLVDELLPLVVELVETPGLLDDLLLALDTPVGHEAGRSMAMLMRRKKDRIVVTPEGPYDGCFQACKQSTGLGTLERIACVRACPNDEIFGPEVDRNAPEGPSNVSLFQRLQALMWESTGVSYEVAIQELVISGNDFSATAQAMGPVLTFDDLASAYLRSVTGDLHLADAVNPQVMDLAGPLGLGSGNVTDVVLWINANIMGLVMGADPTPDEITRFFNISPLESVDPDIVMSMNMAQCRSGRLCIDAHADSLFVVEASGLVDALQPLARAFNDHGKTNLLARMFAVIYSHYPSRGVLLTDADGVELPLVRSNLRSLEPALIEILEDGEFLDALAASGPVLSGQLLSNGTRMMEPLERHLAYVITPDPTLTTLAGDGFVLDPHGQRVEPISPAYLLLEPLRKLNDRLDTHPVARDAWDRGVEGLMDVLLATVEEADGSVHFAKAGGPALAALLLETTRDVWLDEDAAGSRTQWLRNDLPTDIADMVGGRGLAAGAEIFRWVDGQPGAAALLRDAALHVLEVEQGNAEQMTIAIFLGLGLFLDDASGVPLAHFLASATDPSRMWDVEGMAETPLLTHALTLLDETVDVDPDGVIIALLVQGFEPDQDGRTGLGTIWEVMRQVNRVEPGSAASLTADDYAAVLARTVAFLNDDVRGAERLYDFIQGAYNDQRAASGN